MRQDTGNDNVVTGGDVGARSSVPYSFYFVISHRNLEGIDRVDTSDENTSTISPQSSVHKGFIRTNLATRGGSQ